MGFITTILTGSSAYDHDADYRETTGIAVHVPSGGKTINLPDISGGGAFPTLITKISGAAGDTITLHPQTGQKIQNRTGDYVLPGSGRFVDTTAEAPIHWWVVSMGGTWMVFGGPIVDVLVTTVTSSGDLPDAEISLLDTSGGPLTLDLPAATYRARIWTLKLITTDGNGVTLARAGSELIEGVASDLVIPGSTSGDLISCTLLRDAAGNWWVL